MQTEFIEYISDNLTMQGFMARNISRTPQPIVMIVHDWSGCRELMQERAKYFAELGYVAFAVDLYGKGKRGSDTDLSLNQELMGAVLEDRSVILSRLHAALSCVLKLPNVDSSKVLALGFCFGGMCVLDFARSGANIAAVISIHGLFLRPDFTSKAKILSKVLALHGYQDKMVTPEKLAEFQAEMTARGADWQIHVFGNASHAFTNPKANNSDAGLLFNHDANQMTWLIVKDYVQEVFN